MPQVLGALARREHVVLLHRGAEKGTIVPAVGRKDRVKPTAHPAFGLWRGRREMRDPAAYVRRLRQGRAHAL
jgi:hypothetical protein